MADSPRLNDKFPIRESLSPPIVASPIPECAEAVYVSGFVPHATVRVYSNGADKLAEENPPFGFAEVKLNRRVKLGESITATQTVNNVTSPHSIQPVIVAATPVTAIKSTKPEVGKQLFECGIVVPVGNLVPGTRVHVAENSSEIGNEPVAQPWHPVLTSQLHSGGKVIAQQIACEGTSHEVKSPVADPVTVQPAPVPTPSPKPDANSMIPGNDTVTLTGLLVGAGVQIFDGPTSISSGWFATGDANYFPVTPPLSGSSSITATQQLCGNVSKPSDPVHPSGRLLAPIVVGPICPGSRFVIVRGTIINAIVVIMRNGAIVGYGGSGPGDVIIGLGANQTLHSGDNVSAIQYIGPTVSPVSNTVTVVGHLGQPAVEVLGGEPFFLSMGNDQPIDGPVFPRGRGAGPVIRVQACCSKDVKIKILDPAGRLVSEPVLDELFPGYFSATWNWTSASGWAVPGGIPVGRYTVVAHSGCEQKDAQVPFYIIFNPADVNGPARFSFDGTTVWFGTGNNSIVGLHYYLHLSDARVFSIAIKAASGKTDSYDAAIAVARAEEQLFAYSLNYHTQDVVDLLVNYTEAQCADDASCLTALLRAIGIPAHNVTADAGLETGAANWTFDTWVEFLAAHAGSTEWRILHPHQYPNMQPESRSTFGTTRGVATKGFNDVIVMANENWVHAQLDDGTSDVTYGRNECQEPNQSLAKAAWIGELCEQGYWPTPHWDCGGVSARSFRPRNGFRMDDSELSWGGRIAGSIHVTNDFKERQFGRLSVALVSSLLESKKFPEETFESNGVPVTLDPKEEYTLPFEFKLPLTVAAGRELYLWAHVDGRTVALHKLNVRSDISCEIEASREYVLGESSAIRATVLNIGKNPLKNLVANLSVPYALAMESQDHRVEMLRAHEPIVLTWRVRAVAALSSGSVALSVVAENMGGIRLRRPFRVLGPEPPVIASPAFLPKKQH